MVALVRLMILSVGFLSLSPTGSFAQLLSVNYDDSAQPQVLAEPLYKTLESYWNSGQSQRITRSGDTLSLTSDVQSVSCGPNTTNPSTYICQFELQPIGDPHRYEISKEVFQAMEYHFNENLIPPSYLIKTEWWGISHYGIISSSVHDQGSLVSCEVWACYFNLWSRLSNQEHIDLDLAFRKSYRSLEYNELKKYYTREGLSQNTGHTTASLNGNFVMSYGFSNSGTSKTLHVYGWSANGEPAFETLELSDNGTFTARNQVPPRQ